MELPVIISLALSSIAIILTAINIITNVRFKKKEFLEKNYDRNLQYKSWFKFNVLVVNPSTGDLYLQFTNIHNKITVKKINVNVSKELGYAITVNENEVINENEHFQVIIFKDSSINSMYFDVQVTVTIIYSDFLGNEFSQILNFNSVHDYHFSEPIRVIYHKKPKPFLFLFKRYNKYYEEYKPNKNIE